MVPAQCTVNHKHNPSVIKVAKISDGVRSGHCTGGSKEVVLEASEEARLASGQNETAVVPTDHAR